jgi:hypothetical protein
VVGVVAGVVLAQCTVDADGTYHAVCTQCLLQQVTALCHLDDADAVHVASCAEYVQKGVKRWLWYDVLY